MKKELSGIISLVRSVPLRPETIFMESSSPIAKIRQNFFWTPPCMKIGRCVITFYSSSTQSIATPERHVMLRTIALTLITFLESIRRSQLDLSDSRLKTLVSDSYSSIRRKYSKRSLSELLTILEGYLESTKLLYWSIPRRICIPFSRSVTNLVYYLLNDYCGFMDVYFGKLEDMDAPIFYYLVDYVRSYTLPIIRRHSPVLRRVK